MPNWITPALLWFMGGVIFLLIELAAPGVLLIFFAIGAWVTAICLWVGIISSTTVSLAVFIIVSVASLLLLRRRLKHVFHGVMDSAQDSEAELDEFVGKIVTVTETIDNSRNTGKIEIRGAQWEARSDERIEAGAAVEIVSRDNITLQVKPLKEG